MCQKGSLKAKKGGGTPHSTYLSLLESVLAKRCRYAQGRMLRCTKYGLKTRQSKTTGQRKPRIAPYKWFKLPRGHDSLESIYVPIGWTLRVGDGQGGLACCSSWSCKESDTTERLNWTELNWYTPTLFPFNKHSTCFTHFHLKAEIHCYTAGRTGPCHWPLLPGGLLARIQHSCRLALTSISGWKPESCFTLLQAAATRDQFLFKASCF